MRPTLRLLQSALVSRNLGFSQAAASLVLSRPSNGETTATETLLVSGVGGGISTKLQRLQPLRFVAAEGGYGPVKVRQFRSGLTDLESRLCKEDRSSETTMADGGGRRAAVVQWISLGSELVKVVRGLSSGGGMVETSPTFVGEEGGDDRLRRWSLAKSISFTGWLTFTPVWAQIRVFKLGFGLKSKTGQDWAWVDGPGLQAKKADFAVVEDVMTRPNAKGKGMT